MGRNLPWRDAIVASNPGNDDERWRAGKDIIARQKVPGGDPALLYQVGERARGELSRMGYPSLQALLDSDPEEIPLEQVKGYGPKKARQVRKSIIIHEITHSETEQKPGIEGIMERFLRICEGAMIVGHFISLDLRFLAKEMKRIGFGSLKNPAVDTCIMHEWMGQNRGDLSSRYFNGNWRARTFFLLQRSSRCRYRVRTMRLWMRMLLRSSISALLSCLSGLESGHSEIF